MIDLGAILALGCASVAGLIVLRVSSIRLAGAAQREVYELTFPRNLEPAQVTAALRSLAGLLPPWPARLLARPFVVFEASATNAGIVHRVIVDRSRAAYVLAQLKAALPGLRAERASRDTGRTGLARELRVHGVGRLRASDAGPLNAGILASLQPLRIGEGACIQWVIAPAASGPAFLTGLRRLLAPPPDAQATRESRQAERREPELLAAARVGITADDPARRGGLAAQLLGAFHAAGTAEASLRRRALPSSLVSGSMAAAREPFLAYPMALEADELAAIIGIPIGGPQLPGLAYIGARDLPPAPSVPTRGRVLGEAREGERPIAVGLVESLRGLYCLAPTGAGKSTIVENLVCQDMAAGRGAVVVESKGDLIADLCDRVPRNRLDDVIVFDPADAARPVGFNLLGGGEATAELIVDHTVGQFKALYRSYLGPRSEDLLRATLTTLAADPRATLCDAPIILTDDAARQRLLARIDDPVLESVWGWFDALSGAQRAEVISPLMNKLRAFTLRRRLRNVIGQADSGLDLDRIVREQKIVLISLAKGIVGEDAAGLLGSAILSRLWQAIAGRAATSASKRSPLFVYCDEAQDFLRLPVSLGDAIAQSRGYGVGWTISHQNLAQIDADLRQACLANLRSKIVMQTSASDAATLAREFSPHLDAEDLKGLGAYEGYAQVATGPSVAPPASIHTLPPPPPTGSAAEVRRRSRMRYGRPVAEVEAELRARAEGTAPASPIGRRRLR